MQTLYAHWNEIAQTSNQTKNIIARWDDIQLESTHVYFDGDRYIPLVDTKNGVERALLIKKALLRQRVIHEGFLRGTFLTPRAIIFLLPRLEAILEETYYYANTPEWEPSLPDQESINAYYQQHESRFQSVDDVKRKVVQTSGKLKAIRLQKEREKQIRLLLENSGKMEILP